MTIGKLVEYSQYFVVKYQEESTGRYAFDMLIDKRNGQIYPAMGPITGWNAKYGYTGGMMGGMQGGMMWNFPKMPVSLDEAQRLAHGFLAENNLQMTLNTTYPCLYYGFYEFHLTKNGKSIYSIAINGYTGQVLYETQLGPIVKITDLSSQEEETPWDVNGDGRVDISDLVLVGRHFGETIILHESPDPDVNQDGMVDIIDLILVGQHLGE